MGSYCGIEFDGLSICGAKSRVPTDWAMLFQETDRRSEVRPHKDAGPDDEPSSFTWYEADRQTFLRRLSLLGANEAAMKHAFDDWLVAERETWARHAAEWDGHLGSSAREMQTGLAAMTFESWKKLAHHALHTRYDFSNPYEPVNSIEEKFHEHDEHYLSVAGYGDLLSLRALLEACPEVRAIKLDVSDLINGGYYEEDENICAEARQDLPLSNQPLGPTVILGEGSTDLLVLRRSLEAMHPDLVDYFSFFNHSEFSVDGGAAYLVKFLKAFAAAKVSSRIVALFDNDAAGIQAFDQATALNLPANILIARLPDNALARSYPTIGPSGPADLDVNGTAAGIELYLGKDALTLCGSLRPVRWAGYLQSVQKYQGEVEGKAEVLAAFLRRVEATSSPDETRTAFPELEQVWLNIFDLVERNASNQYLLRQRRIAGVNL